ncbi:MAG: SPFH domain-containing protein, partial [Clostridia bacterium]
MEEKILKSKKNGMLYLLLFLFLYLVALGSIILGGIMDITFLLVVGIIWASIGWIPLAGLKIIKPQEALVLTLFGNYVGTLKTQGFYYVNPFCTAVN